MKILRKPCQAIKLPNAFFLASWYSHSSFCLLRKSVPLASLMPHRMTSQETEITADKYTHHVELNRCSVNAIEETYGNPGMLFERSWFLFATGFSMRHLQDFIQGKKRIKLSYSLSRCYMLYLNHVATLLPFHQK